MPFVLPHRTKLEMCTTCTRGDIKRTHDRLLEEAGGYRFIDQINTRNLLRYMDMHAMFAHDWFDERKILSHILFPSGEYNFWDVYTGLLRDLSLSKFQIEILDRPRLIRIHNDIMDVSITYHGMLGTYVWELWGVLVSSHQEMVGVLNDIWMTKCRGRVRDQLKLHPRFLGRFLEDGGTIDQWVAQN